MLRGCRKCKQVCAGTVETTRDKVTSDPLEDIYCQTLKRRLCSDLLTSVFVFVLVTGVFLSTAFCRSTVSLVDTKFRLVYFFPFYFMLGLFFLGVCVMFWGGEGFSLVQIIVVLV